MEFPLDASKKFVSLQSRLAKYSGPQMAETLAMEAWKNSNGDAARAEDRLTQTLSALAPPAHARPLDVERYIRHEKGGQIGKRMGWFVAVPRMLNYIEVPLAGKAVYRALCAFANNKTDLAEVGYNRIALEAGVDRKTAIKWIKLLATEYGLIEIVRCSKDGPLPEGETNIYKVLYPKSWPDRYREQLVKALIKIRRSGMSGRMAA